jgi:hypothetical protein
MFLPDPICNLIFFIVFIEFAEEVWDIEAYHHPMYKDDCILIWEPCEVTDAESHTVYLYSAMPRPYSQQQYGGIRQSTRVC